MGEFVRAAEVQLEMYRWMTSRLGQAHMRYWVEAERRSEPEKADMYQMLAHAEISKMLTADAIWVSPEMSEIVQAARMEFQPEPLEREDFITPTGFCYFAEPLIMHDRHHRKVSVGALTWCPVILKDHPTKGEGEGMTIGMYSSARSTEDDYGDSHQGFRMVHHVELIPLHLTVAEFGDPLDEGHMLDEQGRYTAADEWWKTVQTTLRLMQQRVFVQESVRLPRATRRRMEREKAGPQLEDVLVIRLRRPSQHTNGEVSEEGRDWTHRWIVDGHWRNQPYGPKENPTHYRQIWISPHVKGPEDKPLVVKKRFYKWDR
jgi:hypothetical protein